MDLKALETKWRTVLSSILDVLKDEEFRKLLFNLEKIPQGVKEGRLRGDMPSVIIQYYGTELSIPLIDRQMNDLPRLDDPVQRLLRDIKDELKKLRGKNKAVKSKQTDSGPATKKSKPAAEVPGGSGETQIMKQDSTLNLQAPQRFVFAAFGFWSPLTSIKDIKSSPLKTYVSVKGTVTEIHPVKKVKVKPQIFKLRQEDEEITVTMWDEATELSKDLSVGDVVLLDNMRTEVYFREVSLKSTLLTKITKVQSVGIRKVTQD